MGCIGTQAQNRADHMEDAASGPGLRNIGPSRIEYWKINIATTLDASEDLGWAVGIEALDGIKDTFDNEIGFICQPIAFETVCNHAVILWPDRTKLIRKWIVGRIFA